MKAVQLITTGQPLELRDVEISPLQTTDVLIAVKAAGICHSDAHYRAGGLSQRKNFRLRLAMKFRVLLKKREPKLKISKSEIESAFIT